MKTVRWMLVLLSIPALPVFPQSYDTGESAPFTLRGYIREMPAIQLDKNFSEPEFINFLHNRLNFRWNISNKWYFVAEGRNRLFYNDMFNDFPFYANFLENDPGLLDMSWVWLNDGAWIGHTNIDRFYTDWRENNLQIRVGRQRINWGVNLVSNPNDLFNTYSFFDFDYEERPGTDAVRVQYHTGFASRFELAYSPAETLRESTGAFLWSVNYRGYDLQALAGYYRNRSAAGFGWAGSIGGAGFKGEVTWFYDLEETSGTNRGNVVAATGLDYMFGTGTFVVLELLYNGGYGRNGNDVFLVTQPLQADNIMFSEYAITLSTQHPFSSIMQGGIALMALPDVDAFFVMPSMSYSVDRNLDFEFVAQIFAGGKKSIFEAAGSSWFVSLQNSF
jgi:hypothetical protein